MGQTTMTSSLNPTCRTVMKTIAVKRDENRDLGQTTKDERST